MVKVFISQPMRGLSDDAIIAKRKEVEQKIIDLYEGEPVEFIDSFFEGAPHDAKPLWFLGESLKKLASADIAFFCEGYSSARGCIIEYEAARAYGIKTLVENYDEDMLSEDTYIREGLSFGDALKVCKAGGKIARKGWGGNGMFAVYQKGSPKGKGYRKGIPADKQTAQVLGINEGELYICDPYFQIKNNDGSYLMWTPSTPDVLADDWYLV